MTPPLPGEATSAAGLRVALVDEHELVHRGLAAMLAAVPSGIRLVEPGTASPQHVDIALYDPIAPGAARRSARLLADPGITRVVAYTWNFQPWLARGLFRQGIAGYIAKSLLAADLAKALRAVHAGEKVVLPLSRKDGSRSSGWAGADVGLTAREAEVLALITAGLPNQEICERLVVSPNTVKSYIRSCYRKIGAESRTQAVLWGLTAGMNATPRPPVDGTNQDAVPSGR